MINSIDASPIVNKIFNKNYLNILTELLKYKDNHILNKVLKLLFREFKVKNELLD